MRKARHKRIQQAQEVPITISGGLTQNHDFAKVAPGALQDCENYRELDATHTGQTSAGGFDRYDGKLQTIANPLRPSENIQVSRVSEVPVIWNDDYTDADDTARESYRATIQGIPVGFSREGVVFLNERVFIITYSDAGDVTIFEPLEATGVTQVAQATVDNYDGNREKIFQCANGMFTQFPLAQDVNKEVVVISTNKSSAFILWLDPSGTPQIQPVTDLIL